MAEPTPSPLQLTPSPARSVHYGLVFLAGVAAALIGQRLIDRTATKPADLQRMDSSTGTHPSAASPQEKSNKPLPTKRFDLNKVDRHELLQLPGVGPSMADGILAYRDLNGPYQRIEDLRSVRGIGANTLEKLKAWLKLDPADSDEPLRLSRKPTEPVKPSGSKKPILNELLDLNTASASDLERLPGIGPTLAQRIVEEREKKPFAGIDDLKRVNGIGPKKVEQVRLLVTVGE